MNIKDVVVGDKISVQMKDCTIQDMYVEDGPFKDHGVTYLTVADDNGEIHSVEWFAYDKIWVQGE